MIQVKAKAKLYTPTPSQPWLKVCPRLVFSYKVHSSLGPLSNYRLCQWYKQRAEEAHSGKGRMAVCLNAALWRVVVFSHSKATRSATEVGPRGGGRKWDFESLSIYFLCWLAQRDKRVWTFSAKWERQVIIKLTLSSFHTLNKTAGATNLLSRHKTGIWRLGKFNGSERD